MSRGVSTAAILARMEESFKARLGFPRANNGASSHQLMAIFGWDSLKQAEVYTRTADQIRLAEKAMHMIEPCPTPIDSGTKSQKHKQNQK